MSKLIENIKRLSGLPGVSGREEAVRDEIFAQIRDHCESCEVDPLGNLIAFKKGEKPPPKRLLLAAHMDEVGLIITHIEDNGMLRFAPVGGIDGRVAFGKWVEVGRNRLPGVIGGKAVHHLSKDEKESVPAWDKLFIDIGAASKDEAAERVSPGERVVFAGECAEFGDGLLIGKALDDRAGCALLIELIHGQLLYDCHFAFTVQEEIGCLGAKTAGYALKADIAIVVETTTAADIEGTAPDKQVCKLGGGPVIPFMDKGTVYDKALYGLAFETAEKAGLPCQTKSVVAGGNDARSLQTAGGGARVLAVNLPCRYLHSPSLVISKADAAAAQSFLTALINEIGGRS
ncbi:MAG: M42 family metallopeptidase [Oscillospiraceae bacterium]|nr:M42 family metallopeptidase [Oscillospiraceae bacterium]